MTCAFASPIVALRLPDSTVSSSQSSHCRAEISPFSHASQESRKKKVVVVGSGWAALGSAHHLIKQGFDVTVLDAGSDHDEEVGVGGNGFWFPYRNIFSLVDELGIEPFTKWTKSVHYSPAGMGVEVPVFQDLPRLPTPLGVFIYPQFLQLPLIDRLTALPLMAAAIDFDNTDTAWSKYDAMTARELFKQFGFSERLFREVFDPMLQVMLLAPAEECSAAATLGMLYYFMLAHQQNSDLRLCRGTIREKIFDPWEEYMKAKGCNILKDKKVVDFLHNEDTGSISGVVCEEKVFESDAVILAVGISTLQSILVSSSVLREKEEFLKVLNLTSIGVLSVKMWLDKKVDIPKSRNVCYGFDGLTAWTFSELNHIYDEYKDEPCTVIKAEFYHANQLLPLKDEQIVVKVLSYVSRCIRGIEECVILRHAVTRFPDSATHFFPGSYKHMMRGLTTIPNFFMAGEWIVNRHGSWSQEKAYVTGLEAANRVVDYLETGEFAKIIATEDDESHIEVLRTLNRSYNEIKSQSAVFDFFLQ